MDLTKLLNSEQYDAATTIEGPVLILAGAGSGKTRVLTHRIAHMVKNLNVYPSEILAITFTNKAAGEMRERVRELVGNATDSMWISTFHSSCVRILRREIDKLGYNKNFTIYDSYDQKSLLKQCMTELNINEKDITDREISSKISNCKNELISPTEYKKQCEDDYRKNKIADMYLLYQKKLKANNALDFDDLIFKTVELLKKNKDVLDFYERKFKYIMVDEYQDTNAAQYELIRILSMTNNNLCVVGDDDQCIYEWRGANIQNILGFENDFPGCKVVKLEQNYRSKGIILQAANEVIKNNSQRKNKVLKTTKEYGENIKVYRAFSDRDEADFIASEIKKTKETLGKEYKDFAILYRMNSQSRIFEDAFRRKSIPYRIIGGLKFYDRKEIKDIMGYLKLISNPLDDVSLSRIINIPKRNIGDTTVAKVMSFSQEIDECLYSSLLDVDQMGGLSSRTVNSINKFTSLINEFISVKDELSASEMIKKILDDTGYLNELKDSKDPEDESRVENLKELVSEAVEFENNSEEKSISEFLEKVTLVSDVDNYNQDADSVVMMTIHSSKGLEFPTVFMVGMENGIFPSDISLNDNAEMEESRRLCYVAITRAEEQLYITSAQSRMVFGRTVSYQPSNFVNEISSSLKDFVKVEGNPNRGMNILKSSGKAKPKTNNPHSMYSKQFSMPKEENKVKNDISSNEAIAGRKVQHTTFGEGTIITSLQSGNDTVLTIAFDNMGIKKLILGASPLELL
ncbi:MAG: DNA helicase PcrA [Clostridium sp.]